MTELQTTTAAATMTEVDSTTAAAVKGECMTQLMYYVLNVLFSLPCIHGIVRVKSLIHTARIIAIGAGSAGGGLVFILLLITFMAVIITVTCTLQKHKRKVPSLTANVNAYSRRSMEKLNDACDGISGSNIETQQSNGEDFTLRMELNTAYQPSAVPILMSQNVAYIRRGTEESFLPTAAAKLDMVYDIIEENTTEAQQSNGRDFTLSTEQNIAYQQSAVPMSLNVAATEESSQPTADVELDMVYDVIEENTTEVQQSNGEAFGLSTERNVAYKQSTVPMSSNVAYKSQQSLETDGNKEYDYISTDQL